MLGQISLIITLFSTNPAATAKVAANSTNVLAKFGDLAVGSPVTHDAEMNSSVEDEVDVMDTTVVPASEQAATSEPQTKLAPVFGRQLGHSLMRSSRSRSSSQSSVSSMKDDDQTSQHSGQSIGSKRKRAAMAKGDVNARDLPNLVCSLISRMDARDQKFAANDAAFKIMMTKLSDGKADTIELKKKVNAVSKDVGQVDVRVQSGRIVHSSWRTK